MRNIIILKYNEHHIRGNDRNTEEGQLSKSRQNGDARKGRDGLSEPHSASLTTLGHRGGKVFQTEETARVKPRSKRGHGNSKQCEPGKTRDESRAKQGYHRRTQPR